VSLARLSTKDFRTASRAVFALTSFTRSPRLELAAAIRSPSSRGVRSVEKIGAGRDAVARGRLPP
jgi:hypothetical protein